MIKQQRCHHGQRHKDNEIPACLQAITAQSAIAQQTQAALLSSKQWLLWCLNAFLKALG